jgi:malate dehydrogenase (oxaloacetate-decarboxylating)
MKRAAAYSIADIVQAHELHEEYILPSVFDKRVATALARVVAHEAEHSGLAQRALTSPTG